MVLNVQKMVGTLTIFHLGIDRRSRTSAGGSAVVDRFVLRVGVKGACPLFKKIRLIDSIFLLPLRGIAAATRLRRDFRSAGEPTSAGLVADR